VDDHPVVRGGLRAYLELYEGLTVVGEAGDAKEALEAARRERPDLVLLDLQLPGESGLKLLPALRGLEPPTKVLILTSFLDEDYLREALRLGASGYLLKHAGQGALLDGIRAALRGELPLDPEATKLLARAQDDPLEDLTPREREVLALLGEGLSNKAIAARLGVAEKTVKTHVSSVLAKLNVSDRVQAALYEVAAPLAFVQPRKPVGVSFCTGHHLHVVVAAHPLQKGKVGGANAQLGERAHRLRVGPVRLVHAPPTEAVRGWSLPEPLAREDVHDSFTPRLLPQDLARNREEVAHVGKLTGGQLEAQRPVEHPQRVALPVEDGVKGRPDAVARSKDGPLFAEVVRGIVVWLPGLEHSYIPVS